MRASALWLLCCVVVLGCSERSNPLRPPPTGGACDYDSFSSTCHLIDVTKTESDGAVVLTAHYRTEAQVRPSAFQQLLTSGAIEHQVHATAADAAAAEQRLRDHPDVPCHGEVLVTGSCKPLSAEVDVPKK